MRKLLFYDVLGTAGCWASGGTETNETKDSPPGPPPGEGVAQSPSPDEQSPPSPGRPSQGLLHLRLPPGLVGGLDGLGVLSATGSTTLPGGRLLRGSGSRGGRGRRWAPTATSRLRGCSRGGSSRFPLAHDVLNHLSLLLCCWAKLSTASPKRPVCGTGAFRNCTFSCSFMSARHSQRWRSWTTSVDIARPRDCAVTFVARSARSVAARSSCRTVRS